MTEIVIDIDDKDYKVFKELIEGNLWRKNYQNIIGKCLDAIKHGKVLPKGHGRLIDADKVIKNAEKWGKDSPNEYIKKRNADIIEIIKNEQTIIEADKGE